MVNIPQGSIYSENTIRQSKSKCMEAYIKIREDQSRKLQQILETDSFSVNINIGPNVNLKIPKKSNHTTQEKEYFRKKIKITKKTELCKNWELYHNCYFRDNCSFAHGETELRMKNVANNQKFKTKICKAFVEKMWCQFGNRCQYKHVFESPSLLSYNYFSNKIAQSILFEVEKKCENYDFTQILNNHYMNNNINK